MALQIVQALEAAHGKGVIHRDIKPANIKIASDGKVEVLEIRKRDKRRVVFLNGKLEKEG